MKKTTLFICFILATLSVFSQTFYGKEAQAVLPGAGMVVKDQMLKIPTLIKFAEGAEIRFSEWESWFKNHFKISPDFGLQLLRTESDKLGFTHYRYQQTYKGFPIYSNIFIIHVKNDLVVSMNGQLFDNMNVPVSITLSEQEALEKSLSYVNATSYMWQDMSEEKLYQYSLNDENASYYPKGELVLIPADKNFKGSAYRLAYRFDIYAKMPLSRQWVFVDAATGQVILSLQRIQTEKQETQSNATGSADTKYSGTRTMTTDYTGSTYRLRETGRGLGIETYDMNVGTSYTSAVDFTDTDNNWTGTNSYQDEVARDAHWGTEITYDYFYVKHGRNSIDNAGFKLMSYVHANLVGMGYSDNINAFWDGTRMTYGDGGSGYTPLTTLDICGHEISHGLTENTANLTYQNESGALNEGFSDIFGTSIEFYAKPPVSSGNWTIGEQIGSAFRSMSNPNLYDQPDTYNGTNWYTGTADNGGVHTNSGVLNYWYYLLCQGGSGTNDIGNAFNVTGITMAKAELIAFRTLTVYLTASSTYADTRTASIQAATDLYGGCSQETQSTTNAWYAVGVGSAYVPSPADANFTGSPVAQCSGAPLTVQFSNTSVNANSYKWYFGDGSTSTDANPSHIYTANGNYDVKLVAYGNTCGTDSIIKSSYITIGLTTRGDTVCAPSSAMLTANGSGILKWYSSPSSTTVLQTGSTYTTPVLSSTTSYYVKDSVVNGQTLYGGRTDKTTNGATNVAAEQGLIFTALQPFVLKSVKVYSNTTTTNRTISLKNASGTTISSVTVSVPNGESRLTLNLNVPVGTNMKLTAPTNSNLWRDQSTSGSIYPFTLDNVFSITTSTAGTNPLTYYYYFYDWEVTIDCVSPRTEVVALVNPLPASAGTITGTANVCQGQSGVTYTVPSINNATGYVWSLPSGATIVSGNNTNSITVNFGSSASSGNLSVYGTNACSDGSTSTNFAVTVNQNVAAAGAITGTDNACQNQTGVTYTVPSIANATGYVWSLPSGATITAGNNTNSITVSYGPAAASGNISVYGTSACGNGTPSANFPVTVKPTVAAAGSISGTANVCQNQSGVTYTVPSISNATGYVWSLLSGANITAGNNTNTITVNFGPAATSGNISVYGTNTCGNGTASANYPVNVVQSVAAAGTISGTSTVCQNETGIIYTVPQIANATGYVWSLPSGATITSGNNTNSITVSFGPTASSGNITVYGTNTCENGVVSANYLVSVNQSVAASGAISGEAFVCQNQTSVTYSVAPINNATGYVWSLPNGAVITAGNNTNSITVTYGPASVSGNITVYGTGICGNGVASANYQVTVNPVVAAAGVITGASIICQNQTGVSYTVPPITNATGYVWSLPLGSTIISGDNTNSITVNYGPSAASGNISVYGTNNCGNGGASTDYVVTVNPAIGSAGIITGSQNVCLNQAGVTFSIPQIANATGYVWSLPSGASITSGSNTNSITVNFGSSASSGNVSVYGTGDCGNGGVSDNFAVTVIQNVAAAGAISGTPIVCQGESDIIYTVPVIDNASAYVWSLTPGASITSGDNSNTITVSYSLSATSGTVSVYGTNTCGNGTTTSFPVTVINKPSTPIITLNGVVLLSDAASGNQWYDQNGLINGATNQYYVVSENGDYYVISTINGCSSDPSNIISFVFTGIESTSSNNIKVYPNPVSDELVIENESNSENVYFEIYNSIGEKIFSGSFIRSIIIPTSGLSKGVYFIKIENEKTFEYRKVVKE